MKKLLRCCVSIFVCASIVNSNFDGIVSYATYAKANNTGTLVPEMRTAPISDFTIEKKNILESFIIYKLREKPDILFQTGKMTSRKDLISTRRGKTIELLFSKEEQYFVSNVEKTDLAGQIRVIPCFLNNEPFYIYLSGDKIKRIQVYVFSKNEHGILKSGVFSGENANINDLRKKYHTFPSINPEIKVVDGTDETIIRARDFLVRMNSMFLADSLDEWVNDSQVYASNGVSVVPGRIIINTDKDKKHRAWLLFAQILLQNDPHLSFSILERFYKAYDYYYENPNAFDLEEVAPELSLFVYNLEKGSVNEGGVKLDGAVYLSMINTRDVSSEYVEEAEKDIMEVFAKAITYELGKADKANGKVVHMKNVFPVTKDKVVVGYLSDSVVPTVLTRRDGVVVINSNFVKAMAFLIQKGLKSEKGNIFINDVLSGNMYYSILYSIAIKSIRGHFRKTRNKYLFMPGEGWAQGQRGGSKAYVNILSMMFFWFAIAEGGYLITKSRIELFIDEHPALFSNLSEKERGSLPEDLMRFAETVINPRRLKRIAFPVAWFIFEKIYENKKGVSFKQLECAIDTLSSGVKRNGEVGEKLNESINLLLDLNLIIRLRKGKRILYKTCTLTGKQAETIRDLLYTYSKNGIMNYSPAEINKLRTRIFKETDLVWAKAFSKKIKDIENNAADAGRGKILIAVETDWIPETQIALMQELIKKIAKKGNPETFEIIRGSKEDLCGKIREKYQEEGIKLKDILIFAGKSTVETEEMKKIISLSGDEENKMFIVAVDPEKINNFSYIRLIEMLNMALRAFTGNRFLTDHPAINIIRKNRRYYVFVPSAERIDLGMIKKLYDGQSRLLSSL
jgi:hypothetical protein